MPSNRGGAREPKGGRPRKEPTKQVRIPESMEPLVKELREKWADMTPEEREMILRNKEKD
jgi:hypothetical protein